MIKNFEGVSLVEYLKTGFTGRVGYEFYSYTLGGVIYDTVEKLLPNSNHEKESMVLFKTDQYTLNRHENLEKFFIETVADLFAKKGVNIEKGAVNIIRDYISIRPFIVFHIHWYSMDDMPFCTLQSK